MSRIGKLPVAVPSGVDVAIDESLVTVKGPKGTLSHTIAAPITVAKGEDGVLEVQRPDDERNPRDDPEECRHSYPSSASRSSSSPK